MENRRHVMQIDLGDQPLVKIVIRTNVGNHRADQIVDISAQAVEIHDLRKTDHDLAKPLNPFGIVLTAMKTLTPRLSFSAGCTSVYLRRATFNTDGICQSIQPAGRGLVGWPGFQDDEPQGSSTASNETRAAAAAPSINLS